MKWINQALDRALSCGITGVLLFFCLCPATAQTGSSVASPGVAPKKFALVIGIDSYEGSPLQGCVRDAEKFRDALGGYGGFQPENIALLTDKAATYKAILLALGEQHQKAQRGDLFVFYFSGHGTLFPDEQSADRDEKAEIYPPNLIPGKYDGAICPVDIDSEVNSSGKPWENLLLDDTLAWHFSRFTRKGCTVLFVSDSCHSGAQARDSSGAEIISKKLNLTKALRSLRSANGNDDDFLTPEQLKQRLQKIPPPAISREVESYNMQGQYLLIASSRDIQESGATQNGSLFTNALLEVMRSRPKATIRGLYEDVAAKVKQVSTSKDRLQEPRLDQRYYKGSLDLPFLSLPPLPEQDRSTSLKVVVKIVNERGQAVNRARIALYAPKGAKPAAAGATSANGVFETKSLLKAGDYRLRVDCRGYAKFEDEVELLEGSRKGAASFTVRLKKLR